MKTFLIEVMYVGGHFAPGFIEAPSKTAAAKVLGLRVGQLNSHKAFLLPGADTEVCLLSIKCIKTALQYARAENSFRRGDKRRIAISCWLSA